MRRVPLTEKKFVSWPLFLAFGGACVLVALKRADIKVNVSVVTVSVPTGFSFLHEYGSKRLC